MGTKRRNLLAGRVGGEIGKCISIVVRNTANIPYDDKLKSCGKCTP